MTAQKFFRDTLGRRTADCVGDIDGEKVARFEKALDGVEVDVVRVDEILAWPSQFANRGIGSRARAARLGPDDLVLAIGFVPHRDDGTTLLRPACASRECAL